MRALAPVGVDPNRLQEGYVVIEDKSVADEAHETFLNVSAVYSVLHKQLHALPDLLPVKTAPDYCRLENGRLIVTVENVGERDAPPSMTEVEIAGIGTVNRSTPALIVGEVADLSPIDMPDTLYGGRYDFTIRVDRPRSVLEADESNNEAIGACLIIR
jgi:subtilase family serine protease